MIYRSKNSLKQYFENNLKLFKTNIIIYKNFKIEFKL